MLCPLWLLLLQSSAARQRQVLHLQPLAGQRASAKLLKLEGSRESQQLTHKSQHNPGEAADNVGERQNDVVEVAHHRWPHSCLNSTEGDS